MVPNYLFQARFRAWFTWNHGNYDSVDVNKLELNIWKVSPYIMVSSNKVPSKTYSILNPDPLSTLKINLKILEDVYYLGLVFGTLSTFGF